MKLQRSTIGLLLIVGALALQACARDRGGLVVTPADLRVLVGQTLQLSVEAERARGERQDVTSSAAWDTSHAAIGAFEDPARPGLLTAKLPGAVRIDVSFEGQSSSVVVVIVEPPVVAQQPLRIAVNSRYFEADGKPLLLAGSHTWSNLQENSASREPPAFDYDRFLDFLADHGHNFFRLWAWEQARWDVTGTEDENWYSPSVYERTGPGLALDGLPKFDLTRFNEAYFERLRDRVSRARERGLYVAVMLFNGFSVGLKPTSPVGHRNPWDGHPLNIANNINAIDGDANGDGYGDETHELVSADVTAVQEAYVRKVIDTVNDLPNVLFEISNESHGGSEQWQYHLIDFIHRYEAAKPSQHPVGMTSEWPDGDNEELFASEADWISPGGEVDARPIATGAKVIIADTDHLCGVCGDRGWVWRSFTAGENPAFMDPYLRESFVSGPADLDVASESIVGARKNLGYVRRVSQRIDLARAVPMPHLASTGHCLADQASSSYVVYAPQGGDVSLDLRGSAEDQRLTIEWIDPGTGESVFGGTVNAGAWRSFRAPFAHDAALFLHAAQ